MLVFASNLTDLKKFPVVKSLRNKLVYTIEINKSIFQKLTRVLFESFSYFLQNIQLSYIF